MQHPVGWLGTPFLITMLLKCIVSRPALLLILSLFSSFSVFASDCCIEGIYYNLNTADKTASVTSSSTNRYSGDVVIPEAITYEETVYTVTLIDKFAFLLCSKLTSVTIPHTVTSIGKDALSGCSGLTSVTVDKNNSIYDSRDNCNAIIVTSTNKLIIGCNNSTIPNSVTSIGSYAFDGCSGLTSVSIPSTVTSIESYAFNGCSGLTSMAVDKSNRIYDSRDNCNAIIETSTGNLIFGCKNTTIPNTVSSIGESAFRGCSGLTSVAIPNTVTSIGNYAFCNCSGLTSMVIPNSVTSIGDLSFYGCSGLTSVAISNSATSIGNSAFERCSWLTSVAIPNSVTSIGKGAFRDCSRLLSVIIPNSVTSIGSSAFSGCSRLTSVAIPSSATSIESSTFFQCSRLNSVVIPNSVTSIGSNAFHGCYALTKLISQAVEPPACGDGAFKYVDTTTCNLLVPEESINKYSIADQWREFMYISEYDGVDDVSVDTLDAVYEVYNLQGVRVGSGMREAEVTADVLPHGVYILVSPQGRKKLKI